MKKNNTLLYLLFFIISILILINIISLFNKNNIISGTDFAYPFYPKNHILKNNYLWQFNDLGSFEFRGVFANIFIHPIFCLSNFLGASFTELSVFFILFTIGLMSMFFLLKNVFYKFKIITKYNNIIAFIFSLFFIFNPILLHQKYGNGYVFSLIPYFLLPLLTNLLIKSYFEKKISYFSYIITFVTFSGSTNPPFLLPIVCIWLIYFLFLFKKNRFKLGKKILSVFLLLGISFLYFILFIIGKNDVLANVSLINANNSIIGPSNLWDFLRLLGFWSFTANYKGDYYFPYNFIYYTPIFYILGYTFLFLIIFFLFKLKSENFLFKKKVYILTIFYLVFMFLTKGSTDPFGSINIWFHKYIPFFYVFRQSYDKFGTIYFFFFCIVLAISLVFIENRLKNQKIKLLFIVFFITVVSIYNYPYFTEKFILGGSGQNKYKYLKTNYFKLPNYYYNLYFYLKTNKLDSNLLGIPITLGPNSNWVSYDFNYSGIDPMYDFYFRYITITPYKGSRITGDLFQILNSHFSSKKNVLNNNLLSILNIENIILRKDIDPKLYNIKTISINNFIFLKKENFGKLTLFMSNKNYFLPHFYTPTDIIYTHTNINLFPQIILNKNYQIRTATYFKNQNLNKINNVPDTQLEIKNTPILEFKKINPTKYRVVVHGAKDTFPLVFSESYHDGWRAYALKLQNSKTSKLQKNTTNQLNKYKILDGNAEDQASREEVQDFINKGYISTLGDTKQKIIEHKKWVDDKEQLDYVEKYNIGFISKNFQDTIQNDNLENGNIFETWFSNVKQISEDRHWQVNGYANSWIINTEEICGEKILKQVQDDMKNKEDFCKKNADGSYDFEMIIEFWPQRLFYIGAFISLSTFISCIAYLIYDKFYKRKVMGPAQRK